MQQSGRMDKLDYRRIGYMLFPLVSAEPRAEHDEDGSDPFSAGPYYVIGNLFDKTDPGRDKLFNCHSEFYQVRID